MHPSDLVIPGVLLGGLWLYNQWSIVQRKLRLINNHAGYRSTAKKTSIWPTFLGLSPEKTVTWKEKYALFQRFGWDIVSAVSWFPQPAIAFFVADPVAVKEITLHRWIFPKLLDEYKIFGMFGMNLVCTEGDIWKRHKKICSPTYSEKTNVFVWAETCRILSNEFAEWGDQFECNNVVDFTLTFALKVISTTGFGIRYDAFPGSGHQMSFGEAISIITHDGFLKLLIPEWAMCLTPRFRRTKVAFDELWAYMDQLVEDYHKHGTSSLERDDLFSALLRANQADDGSTEHLTKDELFGNIFLAFFAGHETTSDTLAFVLILLARHPEEQERLYRHVTSILQGCPTPEYSDAHHFSRTSAVINETLRMYPPVTGLPKYCTKDTTLSCAAADSESSEDRVTIPIPQGSTVMIDVPGLHYNEKYWKNPSKWTPDRYLTEWNADAFAPFSVGARACLGRKFFETEATALISMLVAHYEIQLTPGPPVPLGEIELEAGLTLSPKAMPLVFRKRKHNMEAAQAGP